jgi:cell division protein ZipA
MSAVKKEELPTITISTDAYSNHAQSAVESAEEEVVQLFDEDQYSNIDEPVATPLKSTSSVEEQQPMEVLVLHVKAPNNQEFVGTQLFESMENQGLHFGALNIYHRHADISGNSKVLFSVANILQPGTLSHDDPETFTTEGISFFMTLPCYGDPEQNFKLMLLAAQMIADDLSGQVLDDKHMLMTPDRINAFKRQIQQYVQKQKARESSGII